VKKILLMTAAAAMMAAACWMYAGIRDRAAGLGLSATPPAPPQKTAGALTAAGARAPIKASKDAPFVNTLGMKFVPTPAPNVLFCIWETRMQDYAAFITATQRKWMAADSKNDPTLPVVDVNYYEAIAFCDWLTDKERQEGALDAHHRYRLPTDLEWSVAVGLPKESGSTPEERNGKIRGVYPWEEEWPPPAWADNYASRNDIFAQTAPAGSFRPNRLGLYDMGGNVREWCLDWYDADRAYRVLRGASWAEYDSVSLLSSYRLESTTGSRNDAGFRVVLAASSR
jgi:hypothetical protein